LYLAFFTLWPMLPRLRQVKRLDILIVVLLLLAALAAFHTRGRLAGERRRLAAAEEQYSALLDLCVRLTAVREGLFFEGADRIAVSPLAVLEEYAAEQGIRENIQSMAPTTLKDSREQGVTVLEMLIADVPYDRLVRFLHRLDGAPIPLRVRQYTLQRRFDRPAHFDLSMEVAHYGATRESVP
jgi:hypothetical protein